MMRVASLTIAILQAALVNSIPEITGYIGDNVTLPSGANTTVSLSLIDWTIMSNSTFIATYRNGKTNTDRFYQYKGRLELDSNSGNLIIHNVSKKDAMDYTVVIRNAHKEKSQKKVKLTVIEHLQKPTIKMSTTNNNESCWVRLDCSSDDSDINLTWSTTPSNATTLNKKGLNFVVQVIFLNSRESFQATCTSHRNNDYASASVTSKCIVPGNKAPSQKTSTRCRSAASFIGGLLLGVLLTVAIFFLRDKIKTSCRRIPGSTTGQDNNEETHMSEHA